MTDSDVVHHICLVQGQATGWDCPACAASKAAAEARLEADLASFDRAVEFGGVPRVQPRDPNTHVGVNTDVVPATSPREPEKP